MFCKSGILIFIFAENNYSIYAHTMLIKTPCSIRAWVPTSFFLSLSLSLSLYFWLISWNAKAGCITQEILASLLLSLSHRRLRTTRFWSIKGPQQVATRTGAWYMWRIRTEWPQGLLRPVSTKTRVNQLESPLTFLLYLKFRDFRFRANE